MAEYAKLELDASNHGWKCSECGLSVDSIGRPLFGSEVWVIYSKGTAWIENRPKFNYCPKCGKPFEGGETHG